MAGLGLFHLQSLVSLCLQGLVSSKVGERTNLNIDNNNNNYKYDVDIYLRNQPVLNQDGSNYIHLTKVSNAAQM